MMVMVALSVALMAPSPASAHRSPANCNANEFDANLLADKYDVKNGDVINYTVTLDNLSSPGARACDVSGITLRLYFPDPDGKASTTNFRTVVDTAAYAAEQGTLTFGPFPYTVKANAGVTDLGARILVENGTLLSGDVHKRVDINKTIGSAMPTPRIEVDKTGTPTSGQAPQTVTYQFKVYNRTTPPRTLDNVTISDNMCPNVVPAVPSGDDGDKRLQPAEVWVFTCTMAHDAGTFTNTATACGELIIDSGPMPKVCDTDDETVTFTPPPSTPNTPAAPGTPSTPNTPVSNPPAAAPPNRSGVLGAQAERCTLSTPRGLKVRAREQTTIRVTVRDVDRGSRVTITLPGGKTMRQRTDAKGVATFKVKPPRTGRAMVRAAGV
jgi:hypothetical protein